MPRIDCPSCLAHLKVPDEFAGRKVACPKCKAPISIPPLLGPGMIEQPPAAATEFAIESERSRPRPRSRTKDDPPPESRRRRYEDIDEDDEDRPQRKKKRQRSSGLKMPSWPVVLLAVAGFWVVSLALALLFGLPGHAMLQFGGSSLCLAGAILILVAAFEKDVACGLMTLLVPFYGLHFIWSNYDKTWKGFHLNCLGVLLLATTAIVAVFQPPPARPNPQLAAQANPKQRNPQIANVNPAKPAQGDNPPAPIPAPIPEAVKPAVPKLTGDEKLDELLAQFRTIKGRSAVDQFARMPVNPQHQAVVSRELVALIKDNDRFAGDAAVEALGVWATPDDVPFVIELIDNKSVFKQLNAIKALGKLRDERAIKPLIQTMLTLQTRHESQMALRQFGSAVEPEVIPLLNTGDNAVRLGAIQILEHVGTAQSLPALQAIVTARTIWNLQAQNAIRAIQVRAKK